jgi:probable HAF family extracellular repeat protein
MTSILATTPIAVALLACAAAAGEVRFEFLDPTTIDDLAPLSVSADGSAIAGNSTFAFSYETFRWTAAGGAQLLGRATAPVLGVGAGTPDISADGTRISATVLNETSQYATIGVWTLGKGWSTAELPDDYPKDCAPLDQSIGSAWGLSGDGQSVCGLYWRGGALGGGSAHACVGTTASIADLGSLGANRSSRANGASFDGSVVGGWSERADGLWQPVVWVDGVMTQLGNYEAFCEVAGVRSDGLSLVGIGKSPTSFTVGDAYRWDWHAPSASWKETLLGSLPGTFQPFGLAMARAVTDDGSMIVGYNRIGAGNETGFVWTEKTGMRSAADFLAANGSGVPAGARILDLTDISADGSTIVGVALDTASGRLRGFRILLTDPCPADLDGDGSVDAADLAVVLAAWGSSDAGADLDGDGSVTAADLAAVLAAWGDCG